ncbi:Protein CBG15990 [Caenorhabditis briggsae]|nr:Protein CBG15990 [Caenorhabditis briggsae]CAP34353.2 Protein CBG15990 [Caenorhabditis briggsae]
MQSMWIIVLLASTASLALCSATYEDYETPVDSYEMADYMSKPEDGFTKRATSSADRLAAIPRSGLMISGRGWMPGFVDQPRVFKRSIPLHKILVRPMNVPVA